MPSLAFLLNIAQNSYLLARGLRALGIDGLVADSYDDGGGFPMQHPAWEEVDFDPTPTEGGFWDWLRIERDTGWSRPPWAKILGNDSAAAWYDTQAAYQADLARLLRGQNILPKGKDGQRADVLAALRAGRTPSRLHTQLLDDSAQMPNWRTLLAIAARYDLAVLTGLAAHVGPLLPRNQKWVTFEHATMRYVHQLHNDGARKLAAAYQHSDANVITNADCWEAAGMLGVRDRSVFIPHPLDEQAFRPRAAGEHDSLRAQLQSQLKCDLIFFAPARWSSSESSGSKRNDRMLFAFKRYVERAERDGLPRAGLICAQWGNAAELDAAEALIRKLGLGPRVGWTHCLPKRRLARWYRAADVVLDQFSETVGSFGACTVEALASGVPVISYLDWDRHEWCAREQPVLPERPPVLSARTCDEVYESLCWLASHPPTLRAQIGQNGRAWVERWHSLERVCLLHLELYERVLAGEPLHPWPPRAQSSPHDAPPPDSAASLSLV